MTTDNLGSPRIVTDKNGNVISRRDFMPFGEEILAGVGARDTTNLKYTADGRDNIRQRFTGYQKDIETELDFAEARMYQNKHGRFTAPDPLLSSASLDNPQTFNRYVYVGNNPVNLTDPSGLNWCRNTSNDDIKFTGKGVACESGFEDFDGDIGEITQGNFTSRSTNGNAGEGAVVRFNANGSVTVLDPANQQDAAQIANFYGTVIQATSDPVEASPATISDHITSALMTIGENNGGNAIAYIAGLQPYNEHTQLGQTIGNVVTLTQGAIEVGGGLGTAGGGAILTVITAPLCGTIIGCFVPAATGTVTAAGLLTATHGVGVIGNTIYNMSSNQGSSSRSGGSPNNTPQGPSSSYSDSTNKGSRVVNTDTDASPLGVAKALKKNGFKPSRSKDGNSLSFQKGQKKYSLRMNSKSTQGPTLDYSKGKAKMRKIRLK